MLSVMEQLLHSTVRIECLDQHGNASSGTGFFFNFHQEDSVLYPGLVTNRHVVEGQMRCSFHLTLTDDKGEPAYGKHERIKLEDYSTTWVHHPDPDVDLAICPIGPVINALKKDGREPYYHAAGTAMIPSNEQVNDLRAVEDVIMIGYPSGLWDHVNNMPLVRRGITATPPSSLIISQGESS